MRALASLLGLVAAAGLVFFAFCGNLDTNENWYANDVSLLWHGHKPYVDFFYHRLPLFLYSFVPFLTFLPVKWVALRLVSGAFYAAGLILLFVLLKKRFDLKTAVLGLALASLNLAALHIYTTVQSYSLVAFLFLGAVFILDGIKLRSELLLISLLALILTLAQWMRYPVDYIPIAFVIYLVLVYRQNPRLIFFGLTVFLMLHGLLTLVFWTDSFTHDLLLGMFPERGGLDASHFVLPYNNLSAWLRYKYDWLSLGVRWFIPLLVVGIPSAFFFFRQSWQQRDILRTLALNRGLTLSLLLIGGNTAMNFLAPEGHVVQMFFVFPLLIYVVLFFLHQQSLPSRTRMWPLAWLTLVASVGMQSPSCRWPLQTSDTQIVKRVAAQTLQACPQGGQILTFTPLVALESGLPLLPGLEFEVYGYFEHMDTVQARQHHLLNQELLMENLSQAKACAIYLDARFLNTKGNETRLRQLKEPLLQAIEANYHLVAAFDAKPEILLRGPIRIYARKSTLPLLSP